MWMHTKNRNEKEDAAFARFAHLTRDDSFVSAKLFKKFINPIGWSLIALLKERECAHLMF